MVAVEEIKTISLDNLNNLSFDECLIDLAKEYPPLKFIMEINGVSCFPRGDIQAIKAAAKQGKTHTIICLMSALLKGEFLGIKSKIHNETVMYFATEEHERSAANVVKKVHYACGWNTKENQDRFKAASLRSKAPAERLAYISQKIELERPAVAFIDGIRDLLNDINDIKESNLVINDLMRLSAQFDCSIVCVIHTNKNALDRNMRGHLGTELLNKCSDVFEVKKEDGVFMVSHSDCRNADCGEWAFTLDENAQPTLATIQPKQTKTEKNLIAIKDTFAHILKPNVALSYTDLYNEYMVFSGLKIDASKKHVGVAMRENIISKGSDDNYRFNY